MQERDYGLMEKEKFCYKELLDNRIDKGFDDWGYQFTNDIFNPLNIAFNTDLPLFFNPTNTHFFTLIY